MLPLILAVSLITSRTAQLDFPTTRETLIAVEGIKEHGGWKDGQHGELGPYQIKQFTWEKWSKEPFTMARIDCMETQRVVKCEIQEIMERLEARNLRPTPELVYLCWNAGTDKVLRRETSHAQRERAQRFGRLYRFTVSASPSGSAP